MKWFVDFFRSLNKFSFKRSQNSSDFLYGIVRGILLIFLFFLMISLYNTYTKKQINVEDLRGYLLSRRIVDSNNGILLKDDLFSISNNMVFDLSLSDEEISQKIESLFLSELISGFIVFNYLDYSDNNYPKDFSKKMIKFNEEHFNKYFPIVSLKGSYSKDYTFYYYSVPASFYLKNNGDELNKAMKFYPGKIEIFLIYPKDE